MQGGFAKCYELKDLATGEVKIIPSHLLLPSSSPLALRLTSSPQVTAGKIVPKSLLTKSHQKEKMSQEIRWVETTSNGD